MRSSVFGSFIGAAAVIAAVLAAGAAFADNGNTGIWENKWKPESTGISPIVNSKIMFVWTDQDKVTVDGKPASSANLPRSMYGHREGFVLELAEIGIKGSFPDYGLYYQTKFNLAGRDKDGNANWNSVIQDVYFGWKKYNWLDIAVGRMKVPFSQAVMKPSEMYELAFAPTLLSLMNYRLLGLRISGGDPTEIVKATFGMYNSVSLATEQLTNFDQLLLGGRLDLRVENILKVAKVKLPQWANFRWNLAADSSYTPENYDTKGKALWVGADTRLDFWRFTVEAEYVKKMWDTGDTDKDGRAVSDSGWGFHTDLTAHALPGILDITARVERVIGSDKTQGNIARPTNADLMKQDHLWFTLGATVFFTPQASFMVNYIMRRQLQGVAFDTDVVLGMFQYSM